VGAWRCGKAIDRLQGVIAERADLTVAYDRLAFMLRGSGRIAEAVAVLDRAAQAGHADRPLLRSLGSMLRDAGDLPRSAAVLEPLVRGDAPICSPPTRCGRPTPGWGGAGGRVGCSSGCWPRRRMTRRVEQPRLALPLQQPSRRRAHGAVRAIEIDPAQAGAHNGLGVVYAERRHPAAVAEWKKALELRPDFADASRTSRAYKNKRAALSRPPSSFRLLTSNF
jgi:tetratricopeptide (TPR) repeat protein